MGYSGIVGALVLLGIGLAMEWNIAAQMGGPWAMPNIIETIGEVRLD
jgi:hypothetical protein